MNNPFFKIKSILGDTFARKSKIVEKDDEIEDVEDIDAELDNIENSKSGKDDNADSADGAEGADSEDGSDDTKGDGDSEDGANDGIDVSGSDSMGGGSSGGGFGGDGSPDIVDDETQDEPEKDKDSDKDKNQNVVNTEETFESDQQKVDSLFTDTGNIDFDYSLNNENNVRLAKFKFKKSNIDYGSMMVELEKKTGVPADEIEFRLSPEQKKLYRKSNIELRKKYPKIDAREKNIIIYNSDVPFIKKDPVGNDVALEDEEIQDAYKKINVYMMKRYGKYWQDKKEAIKFITSIKVNFSSKKSIRPNLSYAKDLFPENDDISSLPFDKVSIKIPNDVDDFLRNNADNERFKKSSVFRTLAAIYLNQNSKSNGVYAIILPDEDESDVSTDDTQDDSSNDEDLPPDENPDETADENPDDNVDELEVEAGVDEEGADTIEI